jgi:ABC-type uncharacterized transport system substrate-binding protein
MALPLLKGLSKQTSTPGLPRGQGEKDLERRMVVMRRIVCALMSVVLALFICGYSDAKTYPGKKILFIDSYHQGYAWSDGIENGVRKALEGSGVELKVVRMDTKRNTSDEFLKKAGEAVKAEIDSFKPDVVIAADDNASKAVIVPFYKGGTLPFVFCGLNWDASRYGFPAPNVTGMVEVAPVKELLDQLKPFAKGNRIGVIGPDVETNRKEVEAYKTILGLSLVEYFAKDVDGYMKGFLELQGKADMIIIDSDGGLYKDKAKELEAFFLANTKVPTGTCYDFMAPFALLAFSKVAEEQGFWAAGTALKILDGTSPSSIPIVKNKEGSLIVNVKIAKALGVNVPFEVVRSAAKVIE